jgi:hypothetical protein
MILNRTGKITHVNRAVPDIGRIIVCQIRNLPIRSLPALRALRAVEYILWETFETLPVICFCHMLYSLRLLGEKNWSPPWEIDVVMTFPFHMLHFVF